MTPSSAADGRPSTRSAESVWKELTGLPLAEVVKALALGASVRCSIPKCRKLAFRLDHYWPYHEELNRCQDHVGQTGPEQGEPR